MELLAASEFDGRSKLARFFQRSLSGREDMKRYGIKLLTLAFPWLLVITVWYLIPVTGLVNEALVPLPHHVAKKLFSLMAAGMWIDMLVSCRRVLSGLALGITAAVPAAFLLGWYKPARSLVDPLINFFRSLPPIALIPLVIVYFGIDELAKTVMLFYAAFFASVIVMYEGIVQTNPVFIRVARTLGASDLEIFWRVIVPLSVPHILTALRVALGVSWATLVAAELVAAQRGLGAVIQNASNYFQIDTVYAGIISIGAVAVLMDWVLRMVTTRAVRWQDRMTS
jgi:NitT/TauT family transport system permease protein